MNTHSSFKFALLVSPIILALSACQHQPHDPISQYVKSVDSTATRIANDPNLLSNDSYKIAAKLAIPLSAPYNRLISLDGNIVFNGYAATLPQMICVNKDATIITPASPTSALLEGNTYILFTPSAIYVDRAGTGKQTKVPRTPSLPSTWVE